MKVTRFSVQSCCGSTSLILKLDRPIDNSLISFLKQQGFNELSHFTQAGILYVDSLELIVTGPIGSNKLQVKCKRADCSQIFNNFEVLLQQIG